MLPITDDEWREYQRIPDQGHSHRAWLDALIAHKVADELCATADEEQVAVAYEGGYIDTVITPDALRFRAAQINVSSVPAQVRRLLAASESSNRQNKQGD